MIPVPQKLVIDTNVCLDLFVFNDPRWAPLLVGHGKRRHRRHHARTAAR
jgi:hypothetical protein